MKTDEKHRLFTFLHDRLLEIRTREKFKATTLGLSHAFITWFLETNYSEPSKPILSDGSYDGKIDGWSTYTRSGKTRYVVVNSKYYKNASGKLTAKHYEEIEKFSSPFLAKNSAEREAYLSTNQVLPQLKQLYRELYRAYDEDRVELVFITTHLRNENFALGRTYKDVNIFDQVDMLQTLTDDIDGASPESTPLTVSHLPGVVRVPASDTDIPCTVTFARVCELVEQVKEDKYDLLFARNVRVSIDPSRSEINRSIIKTYKEKAEVFAVSNNGITFLADKMKYSKTKRTMVLKNPRIVNGSQTLNSLREVEPDPTARVLIKVIEVEDIHSQIDPEWSTKSQVANQIARRTNEQNPIKSWDLVANDNFQLNLFRLFRTRQIYYDRRIGEYVKKGRERRALVKGPSIRQLAQLIAAYRYENSKLGPAIAKSSVSKLFDRECYELIEKTSPEVAYQLALLWLIMKSSIREIPSKSRLGLIAKHGNLLTTTTLVRAFGKARFTIGTQRTRRLLEVVLDERAWDESYEKWDSLVRLALVNSRDSYANEKRTNKKLTENNFFKTGGYIKICLKKQVPRQLVSAVKKLP